MVFKKKDKEGISWVEFLACIVSIYLIVTKVIQYAIILAMYIMNNK